MTEEKQKKIRNIAYAAKLLALGLTLISLGASLLSYGRQIGHYGVSVLGAILGIIGAAIMLGIGVVVIANVQTSLPTSGLNTQANSTITTVFNQTYTSLQLAPVIFIVLVAGAILVALFSFGVLRV